MGLLQGGSIVTYNRGSVAVGTSSTLVLAQENSRSYAVFVNDSDTVIYLSIGNAAIVSQGIRLNAYGGAYEMTNLNMSVWAIYAIHGESGTKNLTYYQGKFSFP